MDISKSAEGKSLIEVPKLFYSDLTGEPFLHCIQCNKYLLDDDNQYVIEKVIRRYPEFNTTDTILEYGMCLECHFEISKSFSSTSIQNLESYMAEHVNLLERSVRFLQENKMNPEEWVSSCLIKNKRIEELDEYQLCCMCRGRYLHHSFFPYMISGEAVEEIMDLMSNKTLDILNGLKDRFFAPPPEIEKILKDPVLFLI